MNEQDARILARKLFDFLSQKLVKFRFVINEVPVLSQTNGYDCGVHVLCNAEHATRCVSTFFYFVVVTGDQKQVRVIDQVSLD